MSALEIVTRSIADITILDCIGRSTLPDYLMFRHAIEDLVRSGRKKIILNFARISYVDSAGTGELVGAFTTVENHDGKIVIANLRTRVREQLQTTRLFSVFEVFDDEVAAIRYLESCPLHCLCPICGFRSSAALLGLPRALWHCRNSSCRAQFALAPSTRNGTVDLIEKARITTYADEYIEVASGAPFRIIIAGRLNLFASSGLIKLWRALPTRIALFDLHLVTDITPEGREALLRITAQLGKDEGSAISLEGLAPECAQLFSSSMPVYPDDAGALAALAQLTPKAPDWPARFE